MRAPEKICVITANRAEYGLLRWLLKEIQADAELQLQLVVTGSHLSNEFGYTYDEIVSDGFTADALVPLELGATGGTGLVNAMAQCLQGVGAAFERLQPDVVIALGDRYELLPICSAALVSKIPIVHISGGDITLGAIDDQIRNAISHMASLHFPGSNEAAKRLIEIGIASDNIHQVGELGLDAVANIEPVSRAQISIELNLVRETRWVLLTYHPETKSNLESDIRRLSNIVDFFLQQAGTTLIITGANADPGGSEINDYLRSRSGQHPNAIKFFMSLGQTRYIQLLPHVECVVGNSSSAVFEVPMFKIPVINIGDRQRGRIMAECILESDGSLASIQRCYASISQPDFRQRLAEEKSPYGDGQAARRIRESIKGLDLDKMGSN
jgi:UDP-hydrolysing UDP-N-acetyl-D-glucosamine 2-epimerase